MSRIATLATVAVISAASPALAGDVSMPFNADQQKSVIALPTAIRQCVDVAQFGGDMGICRNAAAFAQSMASAMQNAIAAADKAAKDKPATDAKPKEAAPRK